MVSFQFKIRTEGGITLQSLDTVQLAVGCLAQLSISERLSHLNLAPELLV